ncbi:MAG: diguanylate cyclase [Saccharospirillaceae bacterium]|nr:diguanylate cyclase [Pseudomonadales bacterium]NRB78459.1 diguanylate cyclase [Saccharospirillaceae bacterium]
MNIECLKQIGCNNKKQTAEQSDLKTRLASLSMLHKFSLYIALLAIVLMVPFSINHLIQGNLILGFGSFSIILIFSFNAWNIALKARYYFLVTLLGLIPAMICFLSFSVRSQGIIGVLWCYPALISFYFILPERFSWLANIILLAVIFPVAYTVLEISLYVRVVATLIMVSCITMVFVRMINNQQKQLRQQIITDPLTQVFNRVSLAKSLEQAIIKSVSKQKPMTLISIDIDNFKQLNDIYGHGEGDDVLKNIGEILQKRFRKTDKIFRIGGDEFLILLYATDMKTSCYLAEEVRYEFKVISEINDYPVSISIGVACLKPDEDANSWMIRSDQNLYRAKFMGRNQVCV